MTEDRATFGELLRAARLRAGFHTVTAFANRLSELGLAYTDEAIGHWENDRRAPPREVLLKALFEVTRKQAGECIELGAADKLIYQAGTLMFGGDEPAPASAGTNQQSSTLLVVNSTGDGADANPGDGLCDHGSGACTLAHVQVIKHREGDVLWTLKSTIPMVPASVWIGFSANWATLSPIPQPSSAAMAQLAA